MITIKLCLDWRKYSKCKQRERDVMVHYGLTIEQYLAFMAHYLCTCQKCHKVFPNIWTGINGEAGKTIQCDHIDGDYTNNSLSNLQPLCWLCQRRKAPTYDYRFDDGAGLEYLDKRAEAIRKALNKIDNDDRMTVDGQYAMGGYMLPPEEFEERGKYYDDEELTQASF